MRTARSKPPHGTRPVDMDSAVNFVIGDATGLNVAPPIGKLTLPAGSAEAARCQQIQRIMTAYAERSTVSSPLSIAVFGPPGSGKSHCVRELAKSVPNCEDTPFLVNLSQLSEPRDLAQAIDKKLASRPKAVARSQRGARSRRAAEPARTPVFFFDEFDARLGTTSYGWLRWFLAPMQDGEFFLEDRSIAIGKAIFMFAGGTAPTLAEFERRASEHPDYQNLKVPDFISRLRGFIDIQGVNNIDDEREIRRALVLRFLLDKRWEDARKANGGRFPIKPEKVRSLLSNVHFVHGARSMEALLDMCRLTGEGDARDVELPDNDIRKLHLSRGALDGAVIGLATSLSDRRADRLLENLTDVLLRNGATLAYGGPIMEPGTLNTVIEAAGQLPDELVERSDKRIRNYLGFPSFQHPDVRDQIQRGEKHVAFERLNTLSGDERNELGVPAKKWFPAFDAKSPYDPKRHLAWALSLFRMRVRLVQDISALIVLGGKDDGKSWGRFAGIAEEAMLAMAANKPVYVLGGCGGAGRAVGRLLGMDSAIASPDRCLVQPDNDELSEAMQRYADCFCTPECPDLPSDIVEIRQFIFDRSITTPAWRSNGLSDTENRELFAQKLDTPGVAKAVDLIVRGLLRCDLPVRWPLDARSAAARSSPATR